MDNNNVNIPNNNPQIPNNQPVDGAVVNQPQEVVQPVEPPVVNGPVVAPPSVGNNNLNFNEEDGKILVPIGLEPVQPTNPQPVEEVPQEVVQPTPVDTPTQGDGILENAKMEKVEIEYTPPSFFKKFIMIFMFAALLGSIIFMPEINKYLEKLKESKAPVVDEEQIMNGTLSCSFQTNNDTFDLIYSGIFNFSNRELTSLTYTLTTKGDRVLDSNSLQLLYDSCKSLSTDLEDKSYGVKVSCDLSGGTVRVDESIDYSEFKEDEASKLFKQYGIDLADFEAKQNIGDIEKELKRSNYICFTESKSS